MEDTLRGFAQALETESAENVLILILMEDTLRGKKIYDKRK